MTSENYCYPLVAVVALLLASPAAVTEEEATDSTDADSNTENVCFDSSRVRNFDGLSDNFLFVEVNQNELYLLSMRNRCHGLRNAQVIAFNGTFRSACSDDNFVEVAVRDMGRRSICRVKNIERVESKDEAKAVAEDREAAMQAEKD
ncbi:MAG: DUF6491 family protein [Woeseiaceae bacterium]